MQLTIIRCFVLIVYLAIYLISGWLTIELWRSSANLHEWVAIGIGAALHSALYLFAAAARGLPLEPFLKWSTQLLVAVLFLLSIAATMAQLESGFRSADASGNLASIKLQEANRLADLRLKNAEIYTNANRATASSGQIDTLGKDNRDELLSEIKATGAINHLINLLASALTQPIEQVRLWLFLMLAVLLDACGVWSAFLLFVPVRHENAPRTAGTEPKATIHTAEQDILDGVFGQYPSVTKLISRYGIGRGTANGWLKTLSEKGIVYLNDQYRRWEVRGDGGNEGS